MKRVLMSIAIVAAAVGCAVNNDGASVLLTQNVAPSSPPQCQVSADSEIFTSIGVIDVLDYTKPDVNNPVPRNYVFSGLVTNQMTAVSEDATQYANFSTNEEVDADNIIVDGYYVTYVVNPDTPAPSDPGEDSSLVSKSSSTTAYVDSNGSAVVAGGKGVASALILPSDIIGPLLADNPGSDFVISAHIKADTHTQDGRRLESNEILFPIEICYGCLHPECPAGDTYDFSTVCDQGQDLAPGCAASTSR